MSPFLKSKICLAIYLLLFGITSGQVTKNIIDLDRISELLKYPRNELIINNYLDEEKFIYTKKTVSENDRGLNPPVNPESILQSYIITSKKSNSFLPIVITVSKRGAYMTPYVNKFLAESNKLSDTPVIDGGRLPYGKFDLSGTSSAILYLEEMRVPAHPKQIIAPDDKWSRLDSYPKFHMSTISIVEDLNSDVDIRIGMYSELFWGEKLQETHDAKWYFSVFNNILEDNPGGMSDGSLMIGLFKSLNQIVITSPIMTDYQKNLMVPEPSKKEFNQSTVITSGQQENPAQSGPAAHGFGWPYKHINLSLILLALGLVTVTCMKLLRK